MYRWKGACRWAAAAVLVLLASLICMGIGSAASPADGDQDTVGFRPRLDKVQEPALPPAGAGRAGADGGADAYQPSSGLAWGAALAGFTGFVAIALLGLGALELRARRLRAALGNGIGSGSWWPWSGDGYVSWSDRLRGWWGAMPGRLRGGYEGAKAWLRDDAWPWIVYGARAAGHYAAGFAFEAVSDLGFGIGHRLMRLLGKNPNDTEDPWFQLGRKGGAKAVEYWGYLEMLLGITGEGGGALLSLTGVGAVAGVPAIAAGAGVVAVGAGHVLRGKSGARAADEAYRRTGGVANTPMPSKLFSEEEVRALLGPGASEASVQRFMRLQEYLAEKMGKNWSRAQVRELLTQYEGAGPLLAKWIAEMEPAEAIALLERYPGRRQLIGAITEYRLAAALKNGKLKVIEVVAHTNRAGADIYFVDLQTMTTGMADAKGSVSGAHITGSSAFSPARMFYTTEQLKYYLDKAKRSGLLSVTDAEYAALKQSASNPTLIIGTGGSASITEEAVQNMTRALAEKGYRVNLVVVELD